MQGAMESRKLWRNVTTALEEGDINSATEHKRAVSLLHFQKKNKKKSLRVISWNPWDLAKRHTQLFNYITGRLAD